MVLLLLTKFAVKKRKIKVISGNKEAKILGATKPKDVDVAVIDPENGPLVIIGVRSQMSSVSKNVLNYYEGIIGECISLQERFPMSTHGYVYVHPLVAIKEGKEKEHIDHQRYAKMYAAISGRSGSTYKNQRGIFDQFAYMVVDFDQATLQSMEGVNPEGEKIDLSIGTFIDRIVNTFNARMLFWDIFA